MLASYATQLILQGQGVAIVDPHADLAHDVLALLLQAGYFRRNDARRKVLYVDFSNREAALPFNVLRQPYPVDEVARMIVEACSRAWPALADGQAPQFENILLASIPVLIANDLPLTAMTRLLSDRPYRERLLRQVTDPQIVSFFHQRFDHWGREAPLLVESALRRIFLLTYSPTLRAALSQRENALNFRQLMDAQTSVICNLGGLDEETQKLLGCLVTVGYEVAALSRADQREAQRSPYHLILDEFASFSAQSEETLARVLSLTRKYGLFCTLAHQTFSQLSSRLAGALQNTLQICFRIGREDSVWAAPRFGSFDPLQVKHVVEDENAEPRTHPLFLSVQETYEGWAKALEHLKPREAFVRVKGKTVKIRTTTIKHHVRWHTIEALRAAYAAQLLISRTALATAVETESVLDPSGHVGPTAPDGVTVNRTLKKEPVVHRVVPLASASVSPPPPPPSPMARPLTLTSALTPCAPRSNRVERPQTAPNDPGGQNIGAAAKNAVAADVGPLRRGVGTITSA
jgi:hypothetical protein